MANARKTICNMRCFECKFPDCINDTDYVSIREKRQATARDSMAKRLRMTDEEREKRLRSEQRKSNRSLMAN